MSTEIIKMIRPKYALPGAEIEILTDGLAVISGELKCDVGGTFADITAASSKRVLVRIPDDSIGTEDVSLISNGIETKPDTINIGRAIAEDLHIVANPAIDPSDGTLIATRSGSRGLMLENTLYRIFPKEDYVSEMPVQMKNPTGIAISPQGETYVTNRAEGTVCRIDNDEDIAVYASGLGVATGIAFDSEGVMYVGDRGGRIYRVREFGRVSEFANIEPSVAAYHLAFGPDEKLYATAPGLSSHDAVYAIDKDGMVETYCRGFGRPQGIAFDTEGNLYLAASYQARRGIYKITRDREVSLMIAGNNVIGMCFGTDGEMFVATGSTIYSFKMGISGLLLK